VPQSPVIDVGGRQLIIGAATNSEQASYFALRTIGVDAEPSATLGEFLSANPAQYVVHDGMLYFFARDFGVSDEQGDQ